MPSNSGHTRQRVGSYVVAAFVAIASGLTPRSALADEGGVSFWLPGIYGSLAATPVTPGWFYNSFYYRWSGNAGADVATAREFEIGRLNPTLTLSASASLRANVDMYWINPGYAFETPVLGGQAAIGMGMPIGQVQASVSGTVTASLPPFTVVRSDSISDSDFGNGDLYPQASLKWHNGVNNFMIYGTGDIPVGQYSSTRLANMGIGHGAADGGFGYTYFDEKAGHEFSMVAGFTYNLINTSTNYQNGVDFHLDWGASQFVTKQLQLGLVGYLYDQVSGDSGSGDRVGSFESRVIAVGPQIGYILPLGKVDGLGDLQGYLNVKAYGEFDARDRPSGYDVWLTFAISQATPTPPSLTRPMYTK
jgi:hypothetical protein